mgnify:CR=1 FL=1
MPIMGIGVEGDFDPVTPREIAQNDLSPRLERVAGVGHLDVAEVARRALQGSAPEPPTMIGVSVVALAANVTCLVLIHRHRHRGAHMEASYIFSANDVLANLGVIAAGALVAWTGSPAPDLVIGAAIAALVLRGAIRILSL